VGIALAFGGISLAFADGFLHPATGSASGSASGTSTWQGTAGDALGVLGGVFWAATTVVIRASPLARASASKTLFYQLGVSAIVLLALAFALGQTHVSTITLTAVASLAYQAIVVAFLSYLTWFWLLTRYMASRLSVFSFLTPIFGVAFGVVLLGETLTTRFMIASALVVTGIALVNAPAGRRRT
jgi:drug/metabolite transporter (DMT)-like permease